MQFSGLAAGRFETLEGWQRLAMGTSEESSMKSSAPAFRCLATLGHCPEEQRLERGIFGSPSLPDANASQLIPMHNTSAAVSHPNASRSSGNTSAIIHFNSSTGSNNSTTSNITQAENELPWCNLSGNPVRSASSKWNQMNMILWRWDIVCVFPFVLLSYVLWCWLCWWRRFSLLVARNRISVMKAASCARPISTGLQCRRWFNRLTL